VALATCLGLVAGGLVWGAPASAGADPDAPRAAARPVPRVALAKVPGQPLREATRRLDNGRADLRASFAQVAVTWRSGDLTAVARAHGNRGWTAWQDLDRITGHAGVGHTGVGHTGVQGTDLIWMGPSDRVQVRVDGSGAATARVVLIDSRGRASDAPVRRTASQPAAKPHKPHKPDRAPKPHLLSRHRWGANEKWRSSRPRYNHTIKQVHLHHTATGNDYRRRDVPSLIRGMYRYHTHTLRWSDLGYNFLVDRFGRSWEGRAGGMTKPVRGAHTLGFNATSVGIAVIGTYTDVRPRPAVLTALVKLAAWKLDRYHRNPRAKTRVRSQGSDLFRQGKVVRLPVIDGHRDTNATECPGQVLYDLLPKLRNRTDNRVDRFD